MDDSPQTPVEGGTRDERRRVPDMPVAACMARYDVDRQRVLSLIRDGKVSVSMSGIENYPCPARDLTLPDNEYDVETILTWDGQRHIQRPNWRAEFESWAAQPDKSK